MTMLKLRYLFVPLALTGLVQACSAGDAGSGVDAGGGEANGSGGGLNLGTGGTALEVPPGENSYGIATGVILKPECEADCEDFPAEPIVDGVSDGEKAALDMTPTGAGPCVSEPASGTIFPAGWTRPRFNFAGGKTVHRITLSAPREKNTLTIYTKRVPFILPAEIWGAMSKSIYNEDITFSVRTSDGSGAPTETTGTFQIAPVAAGGSMVFWGSTGSVAGETTNALYGFGVGDEGVIRAIQPGEIAGTAISDNGNLREKDTTTKGHSTCVGCHTSTPDGKAVASMDDWSWNIRNYSIEPGSIGEPPAYLTGAGAALLSMTWLGAPTFSSADWNGGKNRMVTTWSERTLTANDAWKSHDGSVYSNSPTQLIWMDLASKATVPLDISRTTPANYLNNNQELQKAVAAMKGTDWEVIPRTGDTNYPVMPDWSHDAQTIVYTSTDMPQDGRVGGAKVVDLYTVPFAGGAGGEAKPVSGADSSDFEYYPDFSPDDQLLAFNKLPTFETNPGREDSFDHVYYRPDSDIYVIPAAGGEPVRLTSNDGVCGDVSGKLYNSWAKWAPSTATDGKTTYYFLIFSTARNVPFQLNRGNSRTSPASQLYMTTIIKKADGTLVSSPAIYLWNQKNLVQGEGDTATISELKTNNVTPAWDEFKIPPVPPVVVK